jgi:hypothetical protein
MDESNLHYRGYSGTIQKNADGTYCGQFLDPNISGTYQGQNLLELEKDFRRFVDLFGVYSGTAKSNKVSK